MGLCVQQGVGRCQAVATLPAYRCEPAAAPGFRTMSQ